MLNECTAHLVAHSSRENQELLHIAHAVGFTDVRSIFQSATGTTTVPVHKLSFFLVHHHLAYGAMKKIVSSLRASTVEEVRFAPIVLFNFDCPFEEYLALIEIGFDDVITLPEKRPVMIDRMMSQIGTEQVYFETSGYCGPDRRRMDVTAPHDHERAPIPHSHIRHHFRRRIRTGIEYLRRDEYLAHGAVVRYAS